MSSEKDPLESISKGATKGALEWTEERIKEAVKKFKQKNLAFIQDSGTIKLAKEQHKTGEWELFKKYVKNKDFRILFILGLTLRKLENQDKPFKELRNKIFKKYKTGGLHIANFVANGLFSKYIGNILEKISKLGEIKSEIEDLFQNIDNKVSFIGHRDNMSQREGEIVTKIHAFSPDTFIISSVGYAIPICEKIKERVMQKISSKYNYEEYMAKGQEGKRIYFLNKINR